MSFNFDQDFLKELRSHITGNSLSLEQSDNEIYLIDHITKKRFFLIENIPCFSDSISKGNYYWMKKFNDIAPLYDIELEKMFALRNNKEYLVRSSVIDLFDFREGMKLLETASGTSSNAFIVPEFITYCGVDISIEMLLLANQKSKKISRKNFNLIQADASERLPIKSDCFDAVLHMTGMQYYQNPIQSINELIRVAKPGATILIAEELWYAPVIAEFFCRKKFDILSSIKEISKIDFCHAKNLGAKITDKDELFYLKLEKDIPLLSLSEIKG